MKHKSENLGRLNNMIDVEMLIIDSFDFLNVKVK